MVRTEELFTARSPETLGGRFLQFPLVRMGICLLFLAVFLIPHNTLIADFIASADGAVRTLLTWADSVGSVLVLILIYRLYVRWVEGRDGSEVGSDGALMEFGVGFLISVGIVGFMVLLMAVGGWYRIGSTGSSILLANAFFHFGIGALLQVLIFRLILFRLSEEVVGTWAAMVGVAAIFGLAHAGNENATAWTTIALVLGDLLLAAAFIFTHRLWMVWGIHMGWNFTQDGVFGMANSGITDLPSWITPVVGGPTWVSGGSFGIEASPVQLVLSVGVGIFLLRRARARGQFVAPIWRR